MAPRWKPRAACRWHQRPCAEPAFRRHRQPGSSLLHGAPRACTAPHHFASPPYTSLRAKLKVRALARELAEYTGNCQLFVVPYTKPQEYIRDNAPDVLFTVLMRRSMLRIAKLVADQSEMEALITGESLAQVASQTMRPLPAPTPRRTCRFCAR